MAFKFIHTADWHIGKSFGAFSIEKRALLSEARMSVIDRIADIAKREDILHVLVAGDVFDSPRLPDSIVRQTMHRLGQAKNVIWYMLPGNHDPAVERGIWSRVEALGQPTNVVVSRTAEVISPASGVALLTAPVTRARTMQDPTSSFRSMAIPAGGIRIGLAHGSVQQFGRSEAEEATVLIAADRAEQDGLHYLALGDWHGHKVISDRTHYSGTPEPESFVDNEPGYVLVVSVDGGGVKPIVYRHSTAQYAWSRMEFAFDGVTTPAKLLEGLRNVRDTGLRHLLRVKLAGQLSMEQGADLRAELDALADVLFSLEVNWEGVDLVVREDDEELFLAESLSALATKLGDPEQTGEGSDARVRQRALQLLACFAAANRGGQVHVD